MEVRAGAGLAVLLLIMVAGARAQVRIVPEDAHFPYRGTLDVMCHSDQPLAACQFRVNHWKLSFPVMDFSTGDRAPAANVSDDEGKLRYAAEYQGRGLAAGDCGLRLTNVFWGRYVVGCRVRTKTGNPAWQSALMTFRAGNPAKFNMTLTPSTAQVRPGGSVSVLCDAVQPLDECSVVVQREDDYVRFHEGPASVSTPHYQYYGAGLEQGECGVQLNDVTPEDSGPVWCWGEAAKERGTARAAIVTVITPPGSVKLTLSPGSALPAGAQLTADCRVDVARPAAQIVWLLGGEVLRRDPQQNLPAEQWTWPWEEQSVTQRLQLTLKPEHQGKELVCVAEHPALAQLMISDSKTLTVSGAPGAGGPAAIPISPPNPEGKIPNRLPSQVPTPNRPPKRPPTSPPRGKPSKPSANAIKIVPEDAHFPYRGTLDVMCHSDQPLAACQFRVNHWKISFPVMDFSTGDRAPAANVSDDEGKLRYAAEYYGAGLAAGDCGLRLSNVFWGRYVVGCRVRTKTGNPAWQSALMTFRAGNPAKFNMSLTPSTAQIRPGESVSVLCDAAQPIDECSVVVQREDDYVRFHEGPASVSTPHYQYYGAGLDQGECGVQLNDVTPEDSGPVWCWGEAAKERGTARAAIVTVITPPESVKLTLSTDSPQPAGAQLTADCRVDVARPAAHIVWMLGGEVLRRDPQQDLPAEQWTWPWEEQSVTQQLQLTLTPAHNGKELVCVAEHPALGQSISSSKTLVVGGGPGVGVQPVIPVRPQRPSGDVTARPNPGPGTRPTNRPNRPTVKPSTTTTAQPPHRPGQKPTSPNRPGKPNKPNSPVHPQQPQQPCQQPGQNGPFAHPQHPGNHEGPYPSLPVDPDDPHSIYFPGPHAGETTTTYPNQHHPVPTAPQRPNPGHNHGSGSGYGPFQNPYPSGKPVSQNPYGGSKPGKYPGSSPPSGQIPGKNPGHGPSPGLAQSPYPTGKPGKYPNKPPKQPGYHPGPASSWAPPAPSYGGHHQQSNNYNHNHNLNHNHNQNQNHNHHQGYFPHFNIADAPFLDPGYFPGFHSYSQSGKPGNLQVVDVVEMTPEPLNYAVHQSGVQNIPGSGVSSARYPGANPQALYFNLTPGPDFGRQLGVLLTTLLQNIN